MKARHVVVGSLVTIWISWSAPHILGQSADDWRTRFAAGEQARQAGDDAAYSNEMAAAAEAMPKDHLNRPFVQYHAARAAALEGRGDDAVAWLSMAWEEDIESLMISFAPFDPAFSELAETSAFRDLMVEAASIELSVRPLGGRAHLIQGAGSNVLAHVGPEGVLLVDTGYGPALPALRSALRSLGSDDVRLLLVTHPHEDHMGATPELGETATVIAHPGTAAQMDEPYVFMEGVSMPPKPATARPDVVVSTDTTITFNGERIRIIPTVAHTGGDLSIYFTDSHVAHFGDAYLGGNPMMYPGTDDPDGFLDRLEAFVDSMDEETVVLGGHEEPTDLGAVRAQISASRACMSLVRGAIADGLTMEETAQRAADQYPPQWVGFFYQLFSQPSGEVVDRVELVAASEAGRETDQA